MRTLTPIWNTKNLSHDLWREMDRMLDHWVSPHLSIEADSKNNFATEVAETEDHFLVSIDLPGMKREDIKVEMIENTLTVSGERKQEYNSENSIMHVSRKNYGNFKQSFSLPGNVKSQEIQAKFENGVLELFLPKKQVEASRQIEIKSSDAKPTDKSNLTGQI